MNIKTYLFKIFDVEVDFILKHSKFSTTTVAILKFYSARAEMLRKYVANYK